MEATSAGVTAGPAPMSVSPDPELKRLSHRALFQLFIAEGTLTPCTLLPTVWTDDQHWLKVFDVWDKSQSSLGFSKYQVTHFEHEGVTYHVVIVERGIRSDGTMLADGYILCNMKVKIK